MTRIKICGITNKKDALAAAQAGAHALGFVFGPSPRQITAEKAREIIQALPPYITLVGVFVDEKEEVVRKIASFCWLDVLQFHGQEGPDYCASFDRRVIKAVKITGFGDLDSLPRYRVSAFLIDSQLGPRLHPRSLPWDWSWARKLLARDSPLQWSKAIISGGLTPENVKEAVALFRPLGVDVSSGIERTPGQKDHDKMRRFILAVQEADREAR